MNFKTLTSSFVLLALVLGGCNYSSSATRRFVGSLTRTHSSESAEAVGTNASTTVISPDGVTQITIPSGWRDVSQGPQSEQYTMVVAHESSEMQIGIKTLAKVDSPAMTFEALDALVYNTGSSLLNNAESTNQEEIADFNGFRAVRYEFRGAFDGHEMVAIAMATETSEHYHLILMIAGEEMFEQRQDEFTQVINSFREVQTTAIAP